MPEESKPDTQETEVEETEETAEGAEGTEEESEEWSPPSKEEWEKLSKMASIRKKERDDARRDLAKARDAASDEDKKPDEAAKWRDTAARASAATALQAAGYSGSVKQARLLTRLLDFADVEPDEHGDFDFEEQIDDLKESFPVLFQAKERRTPSQRPSTADKGGNGDTPGRDKTSERMLRAAGYIR